MKNFSIILFLGCFIFISILPAHISAAQLTYEVKSGDSVWSISNKLDIPQNLLSDQMIDPYSLKVGERVIISRTDDGITISLKEKHETVTNGSVIEYTVSSGDTLWKIARKYDTEIENIVELNNNITNSYTIHYGQKLLVPVKKQTPTDSGNNIYNLEYKIPEKQRFYSPYTFYKITDNDHIWNIADDFGVSVSTIVNENNISSVNEIKSGETLIIPLDQSTKFNNIKRQNKLLNNYYKVHSGDSLEEISDYFNIPKRVIKQINNLSSENLYTGQELLMPVIPVLFDKYKIYTVKIQNEPVHEIAYQHGLSIRSILKANYLTDINAKFNHGKNLVLPLNQNSQAVWIDYEDGKALNSLF